jgi:large subunit ribosomal protein L25
MEQIRLMVQKRSVLGKQVRRLRREGWVPAVLYGHGVESLPIQALQGDLGGIVAQASLSRLIALQVGDEEAPRVALIRDVQRDVLTEKILHVDFLQIQMAETLRTTIPLQLIGESPVTEQRGGMLLQGITEVEIECLPGDLVDAIEVDVSALLAIDQELTIADLTIPQGIEVLADPQEMVVRAMWVREEEEEEAEIEEEAVVSPAEVEIITQARREEED